MKLLRLSFLFAVLLLISSKAIYAEIDSDLSNRLKNVKLVILDVDGSLADGQVSYSSFGTFNKNYHVHDRMGLLLLQNAGIELAIITGENSDLIRQRAERLNIKHLITECTFKKRALEDLAFGLDIPLESVCYIGDDIIDEAAMLVSGVRACPADAVPRIKNISHYVCTRIGGHGAVREVAELILEAQGKPNTYPEK